LLLPTLCRPADELPVPEQPRVDDRVGERTAMMPKRTHTRAQNRAYRVATERLYNQQRRKARRQARFDAYFGPAPPPGENDAIDRYTALLDLGATIIRVSSGLLRYRQGMFVARVVAAMQAAGWRP
jgi:hypothetical protein